MSTDYDALLDDEIKGYIAKYDAMYPTDTVDLDIEAQRRIYDEMAAAFDRGRPDGVDVIDERHGGVPCRRYEMGAADATVLYVLGGGFVVGGLDSHDSICAEICANTGLRVVAVDYPLAPENTYPADFDAAWAAFISVSKAWATPVVLCGDSAGGNLCAAVAHKARDESCAVAGQVLIYPGLGGDWTWPSYVAHAEAPHLTVRDMQFYMHVRPGGEPPKDDPYYAPLQDTDFSGLPPTICLTAQCDPLSSDGDHYARRITAAGGQAMWIEEPGLIHAHLRARGMSMRAADAFDRVCRAVAALGRGDWPADLGA